MHISELLRRYGEQRDVSEDTRRWLALIVGRFERHLGRPATTADFSDEAVNAWASELLIQGELARSTVKGYRRGLLILWRFAVEDGHCERLPLRIRRIKVRAPVPVAWAPNEVCALVASAAALNGSTRHGVARSKVTVAVILTAWDSGLRLKDLLQLKFSDIDVSGRGAIVQNKTGNPVLFQLSPPTMSAIEEIRHPRRQLIFGDVASRKAVFFAMRAAALKAGLSGGTKKIRKSGATAIEMEHPGASMGYLGHRTPGLNYKHYVDPRLVQKEKPSPPQLDIRKKDPTDAA